MHNCAVIDAYGATPLHVLCNESYNARDTHTILGLASLFIAKGCPINVLDHEGTTALHHCVINDLLELAEMLLSRGANPNALIPDSQVSPLTIAALEKNMAMAQLLIHYGADPHIRTREGSTPVSIHAPIEHILTESMPIGNARRGEDMLVH
jgi:ankyrin repeat protein